MRQADSGTHHGWIEIDTATETAFRLEQVALLQGDGGTLETAARIVRLYGHHAFGGFGRGIHIPETPLRPHQLQQGFVIVVVQVEGFGGMIEGFTVIFVLVGDVGGFDQCVEIFRIEFQGIVDAFGGLAHEVGFLVGPGQTEKSRHVGTIQFGGFLKLGSRPGIFTRL